MLPPGPTRMSRLASASVTEQVRGLYLHTRARWASALSSRSARGHRTALPRAPDVPADVGTPEASVAWTGRWSSCMLTVGVGRNGDVGREAGETRCPPQRD